jgi:hypothetical protein
MKTLKTAMKRILPRAAVERARNMLSIWHRRNDARYWRNRIDDVIACPDNQHIARVRDAGKVIGDYVVMHNGIKVGRLSYYGAGILNMLIENRGVHEPQEERAFEAVLPHLPARSTMLELGAYWAYYSLWFSSVVEDARCFLVEPVRENLRCGESNFRINNAKGNFTQAFVGSADRTDRDGTRFVAVDPFCERNGIERLAILHADIQGSEADMLRGAEQMLGRKRIDWIFISTHSNKLHHDCVDTLNSYGYTIMASADLDETYSVDGLIVAKAHAGLEPGALEISKKCRTEPLKASSRKTAVGSFLSKG